MRGVFLHAAAVVMTAFPHTHVHRRHIRQLDHPLKDRAKYLRLHLGSSACLFHIIAENGLFVQSLVLMTSEFPLHICIDRAG